MGEVAAAIEGQFTWELSLSEEDGKILLNYFFQTFTYSTFDLSFFFFFF